MTIDLAFLFPGQGSQSLGMLTALAERHPVVHATFAEASEVLGLDLWAMSSQGPEEAINQTINTQPLLLTASVAVWRAWKASGGADPALMAGHSLGEYSALVCAGAIEFADGVRVVRERGRLMQAAVAPGVGAMAAVLNADLALLEAVCREASNATEPVVPANLNAPGQIVISGHSAALDRALVILQERGVKRAIRLQVSVPSHSPMMRAAADELAAVLAAIPVQAPRLPVIHNADVHSHSDPDRIRALLALQLHAPVRWIETMALLVARGIVRAGECGPGKVLLGLLKRAAPGIAGQALAEPDAMAQALTEWKS